MKGTALVTGASAGLGRDYARLFAADGHDVVLVARRGDRLEQRAREIASATSVQTHVIAIDLASPGAARQIEAEIRSRGIAIDFLVNNAGFGTTGPFADADVAKQLEMIQLNVSALVELTRL